MTDRDNLDPQPTERGSARARPAERRLAYGLIPLVGLLEDHGIDARTVLTNAEVPMFALTDPRYTIGLDRELAVLRQAAPLLPRHAGVELAERYDLRSFSVLGSAMSACDTLGEALALLGQYPRLAWGAAHVETAWDADAVRMRLLPDRSLGPAEAFVHERDLATVLHLMRELSGAHLTYRHMRFAAPAPADPVPFASFFGTDVEFGAEMTECVIDRSAASLPLPRPDARTRQFYEAQCAAMSDAMDRPFSFSESVRERLAWSTDLPGLDGLAGEFLMTPRTLQRRLGLEGHTFAGLLRESRIARARSLLERSSAPLAEIAVACGFSDETALSRAFKSWTGARPARWRRERRAAT